MYRTILKSQIHGIQGRTIENHREFQIVFKLLFGLGLVLV